MHGPRDDDRPENFRYLVMMNGSTLHGSEVFVPGQRGVAESYFAPVSGVGRILKGWQDIPTPRRVGVIGLGVGNLAVYGRKDDVYRFYELNPVVDVFARKYFTYLRESYAKCEVILGDGRLSLEAEPPQQFDLLVLDAFTSDSIPTHLLTLEAFDVWLRHIRHDGRIAVHTSNGHMDLKPMLAAAARHYNLVGALFLNPSDPHSATEASEWVVLARNPAGVAYPTITNSEVTPLSDYMTSMRPWTDSFSSLLGVLR